MQYRFIFTLVSLFFLQTAFGQVSQPDATTLASNWSSKYDLDEGQQARALKIAQRKSKQLTQIAPLKETNPKKYYAKLNSVQEGTLASIKSILSTPEQLAAYQKTVVAMRSKRAEAKRQLKASGASKAEVAQQLILIHEE
jgi:cysteinyl-tRNA synthetase